jgi:glycosyltransferase involved in cell wall biosynthesis
MLRRGHRADVVVGTATGAFLDHVPREARLVPLLGSVSEVLLRSKSLRMAAAVPPLVRYLKRNRPDVMLSSGTPANLAALVARRVAGTSTAVAVSVNVPVSTATAERSRPLLGRLVRRWYPEADAVIANAAALAEDVAKFAELDRALVSVIPNPVDTEEIVRQARRRVSHPWVQEGPAEQQPLILAVGKLKPQKDFATLVRAFAEARRQRPLRLLILGEGEERSRLLRLAESLGVAEDVAIPGFSDNPFAYMARAAMLVQTSRWEGFSNVVTEALACGCPVVVTDCPGGTRDILDGGRFGRLVDIGDASAIAEAILDTLAEAPPRELLRRRAESFGIEEAVERYLEVLGGCLEHRHETIAGAGTRRSPYSSTA